MTTQTLQAENTKFVSYFLAESEFSQSFLESGLVTLFNWLPKLKYVGCLLPDTLVLYPPFSLTKLNGSEESTGTSPESVGAPSPLLLPSPNTSSQAAEDSYRKRGKRHLRKGIKYFTEEKLVRRGVPFTLSIASRRDFVPSFKIRKSRVEDCDDLMPMLKRQNVSYNINYSKEHN